MSLNCIPEPLLIILPLMCQELYMICFKLVLWGIRKLVPISQFEYIIFYIDNIYNIMILFWNNFHSWILMFTINTFTRISPFFVSSSIYHLIESASTLVEEGLWMLYSLSSYMLVGSTCCPQIWKKIKLVTK